MILGGFKEGAHKSLRNDITNPHWYKMTYVKPFESQSIGSLADCTSGFSHLTNLLALSIWTCVWQRWCCLREFRWDYQNKLIWESTTGHTWSVMVIYLYIYIYVAMSSCISFGAPILKPLPNVITNPASIKCHFLSFPSDWCSNLFTHIQIWIYFKRQRWPKSHDHSSTCSSGFSNPLDCSCLRHGLSPFLQQSWWCLDHWSPWMKIITCNCVKRRFLTDAGWLHEGGPTDLYKSSLPVWVLQNAASIFFIDRLILFAIYLKQHWNTLIIFE